MNRMLTVLMAAAAAHMTPAALGQSRTIPVAVIDHMIRAQWKAQGIVPSTPVDDAGFIRRAYVDIAGTIPTADAVTAFLADPSRNKRARLIDSLLASPQYADHWADYWDGVLMGVQTRSQVVDRYSFHQWLHAQFAQDTPWNQFVYDLITAGGQNSTGGSYAKALGFMRPDEQNNPELAYDPARENGAVNWYLKYLGNPQDLAGQASKIFLGVQIQCAQCHDGKNVKWKQTDFQSFTACFINTRPVLVDRGKVMGIRRVDVRDFARPFLGGPRFAAAYRPYVAARPAALDGTDFSDSPNRRQALAQWMTAPENQWFAEAIVNRIWNHFLGRGFVEPVDDFRDTNPPVMPRLLQALAEDFVAHGYDLKSLIRTICATQVYQLSSGPARKMDPGNMMWARYRLVPLGSDELLNAIVTATGMEPILERVAGARLEQLKFAINRQFSFLFNVDEEFEQKDFQGTIPQALMLLNGNLVNRGVSVIPGDALSQVLTTSSSDPARIDGLYLRTLSRHPTPAEMKTWLQFVDDRTEVVEDPPAQPLQPNAPALRYGQRPRRVPPANGPDPLAGPARRFARLANSPSAQAYEDLFWALLNCSEFVMNH